MSDFPSFDSLFRIGRDEILARNAKISREAVEREGTDANILVAAAAGMADEVMGQIIDLTSALFLKSATGTALDALVFDRYGMVRKVAAASVGSVQFRTTAESPTTFTIPTGVLLQTDTGIQFVTIESTIFTAGSTGPLTVMVRSVLAGAAQNVKIGQITSIVSVISGSPQDLVVTNPYATAGGDDAETDESLRDRAQKFFTTARRGTISAIEAAALSVGGVRTAKAFEVLDALGRPARYVQLVVADAFTEQFADYTTIPPRYQTQSQVLASQVYSALDDVRPAGIFVQVTVANVILQTVQLSLTFQAGADVNTSALLARSAAVNYVNSLVPGATFKVQDLLSALQLVTGLSFTGSEVVSPAGDIVTTPLQVIRTSLGLVSALAAQQDHPVITGVNPDAFSLAV